VAPPGALYAVDAGWDGAEFVANAQCHDVVVNGLSAATKGVPNCRPIAGFHAASR